jgi:hypothetical protein
MLDFDLSGLYGVETRVFNQAIKRNISRFPEDFMFQLTAEEWNSLQIVISSEGEKETTEGIGNQSSGRRSQFVTASAKFRKKAALPYAGDPGPAG